MHTRFKVAAAVLIAIGTADQIEALRSLTST